MDEEDLTRTNMASSEKTDLAVETDIPAEIKPQSRNFAFLNRQEETLDAIEEDDGTMYRIPAQVGSTYWAILKVCYMHHDEPLRIRDIINEAAEILEDRDPEKWEKFKNKKSVRTQKNGQLVEKKAQPWQKRLETNIKTLTRHGGRSPYGERLRIRGHILRWEPGHFDGEEAYVLRTDTSEPLPRNRGRRKKED